MRVSVKFRDGTEYEIAIGPEGVGPISLRTREQGHGPYQPVQTIPLDHWEALARLITAGVEGYRKPIEHGLSDP